MSLTTRSTRGRLRTALMALGATVLFTAVAGCSALGGSNAPAESNNGGTAAGGIEHPKLNIGVLPIVDVAAIQQAQVAGYFKAEGLDVTLTTVNSGAEAMPKLIAGDLDMTWTNWTSVIQASQAKIATGVGDLRVLNASYQAAPGSFLILTRPENNIKSPQDLVGKKIAINAPGSITELIAKSALQSNGVDPATASYPAVAFPDMPAALASHQVDATVILEPFLTAEEQAGAVTVLDAASGPTSEIPIAGITATGNFVQQNPNTVAAFQRAVSKAQAEVANRSVVEKLLPSYTKITPDQAPLLNFGTWPTTIDATRLQRVADLMTQFQMIPGAFDVKPLLAGTATG
jgi:NitT/TauT family transport system substrate-binding protein